MFENSWKIVSITSEINELNLKINMRLTFHRAKLDMLVDKLKSCYLFAQNTHE